MMRISAWAGDLSDSYLRSAAQLGVDCLDFGDGRSFPGVAETGVPDAAELQRIRQRLRGWGLAINRVTLPDLTTRFMQGQEGADRELDNACEALRVYADTGVSLLRQRFAGDTFPQVTRPYRAVHRGGYLSRGESLLQPRPAVPSAAELDAWWDRFRTAFDRLVPAAENAGVRLAVHPSDSPVQDTPLGGLGLHRVVDAYPSRAVGLLYCCGTRAEAGGSTLVLDEIASYGRKGRIAMVHLRNVRGSLATAGAYEETLMDDGDMNLFTIVRALRAVGFDGCLNPDHVPLLEGDAAQPLRGLAYSVGYLKALLAALAA